MGPEKPESEGSFEHWENVNIGKGDNSLFPYNPEPDRAGKGFPETEVHYNGDQK